METLKERIESALENSHFRNDDRLLAFMDKYGFYDARCNSHSHWRGGLAQHSWCVYNYMLDLRDHPDFRLKDIAGDLKDIPDGSIAIAGLLHDLGKICEKIHGEPSGHGNRSARKVMKLGVVRPTSPEFIAIKYHHCRTWASYLNQTSDSLLRLLRRADEMSAGTAWNPTLYLKGLNQRCKLVSEDRRDIQRIHALDRTSQMLNYGRYMDCNYNMHHAMRYTGKTEFYGENPVARGMAVRADLPIGKDCFEQLRQASKSGRVCVIVGDSRIYPGSGVRHGESGYERELFICSNILGAFYTASMSNARLEKSMTFSYSRKYDSIADMAHRNGRISAMWLPDVVFHMDGEVAGYRLVPPWSCDVIITMGRCTGENLDTALGIASAKGYESAFVLDDNMTYR